MTGRDKELLKDHRNRLVRLHMNDGEIVTAKVLAVSDIENDVIVDLVSSTMVGRYERSDVQPAFQYLFQDIAWVEPLEDQQRTHRTQ